MKVIRILLLLVPWLGTWLVWREARRQQARFDRLFADLNNIKLERMEVRDSEMVMEIARGSLAARLWAGIWLEVIDGVDAPNFLEFRFALRPDAASQIVVTVQRVLGKTPGEKLREAEERLEQLQRDRDARRSLVRD
jgi:hypothetical protein